jgi:GTPase SAR1 family protein
MGIAAEVAPWYSRPLHASIGTMPHDAPNPRSILIFALSGLGKTTLCQRFPAVTYDTDIAFDAALALAFPDLAPDARYIAWRSLARSEPWRDQASSAFHRWASTRRRFIADILAVLNDSQPRLVLTNLSIVPWQYRAYFGIELGRYEEHWRLLERDADNAQTEASNSRLEGFAPLVRLQPGQYLSGNPVVSRWVDEIGKLK